MRRLLLRPLSWLVFLIVLSLIACADGGEQETRPTLSPSISATAALVPTPTLLPELAVAATTQASLPPTATAVPTLPPTPTPTPSLSERLTLAQAAMEAEDFANAASHYEAALGVPGALTSEEQRAAIWNLGVAYLQLGRATEATQMFEQHRALVSPPAAESTGPAASAPVSASEHPEIGSFYLAESYRMAGSCEDAVAAYQTYLRANPDLAAYIQTRVATCSLATSDTAAAIAALEAAVAAPAHRLTEIETRQRLAELYEGMGNYTAAATQYNAIHDLAVTENTRGQMAYLAGTALLQAGNGDAAYERYRFGVDNYPRAYESYLGLIALIDAGYDVDPFQRGLIDYYAEAYEPAITALEGYVAQAPQTYRDDARLYLAWSYESLGNVAAALEQLDLYAQRGITGTVAPHAAEAGLERGALYARAGQAELALATYVGVATDFPETEEAREAAWRAPLIAENLGDTARAIELYQSLADSFPDHEAAPRALFRAGLLLWREGRSDEARSVWQRLARNYADNEYGSAALVWLLRTTDEEARQGYVISATQQTGANYYGLRAREVAQGMAPFTPPTTVDFTADEAAEQAAAAVWLASWLGLEPEDVSSILATSLREDERFVRGEKLWTLGLYGEAKRELEELREAYADDAVASYQLALAFRDLGLYRSSILAAESVLRLAGQSVFEAPRLIGRLSYPVYYQELILPLAAEYGYDPLLQFALVRQESLFESFIASHVGAQGLSQVMPATGEYIAQRLEWPDYRNEDLYRPYAGLAFGAYYLDEQLRFFDGDIYAALSAYNAGPGNAARWHAAAPDDPDRYLEEVDYAETRSYIRRIYTGYVVYRHLYGEGDN